MRLAELARDTTLVPTSLSQEERSMRGAFIIIRVRQIRAASPDPTDIPEADVPALRTQLKGEISQAATAYTSIRSLVEADSSANRLLSLANVDQRMRNVYQGLSIIPGNLPSLRTRMVREIVWWAVASDSSLLASANIADLHILVDRRLRVAERMLYDVGRVSHSWHIDEIFTTPGGPWKDGWNRIFEYPRVPQKLGDSGRRQQLFMQKCNPDATDDRICQNASMTDWQAYGSVHLHLIANTRLNPSARALWERPPSGDDYEFYLVTGADPVHAIEWLFTPSYDFKNRNLLYCDHVIHVLHMESLLWAKKKHSVDTTWLTTYLGGDASKLRITVPIWDGPIFLAGQNDGTYFEFRRIHVSELQLGDHLIVYNHPAYDRATVGGVWRLENALVIQVYPKQLLQGHGTNPLTIGQMKAQMIGLFRSDLIRLRKRVTDHLTSGSAAISIDCGSAGRLVRRVDPGASKYIPAHRKADWWLCWDLPTDPVDDEKDEIAIAASPSRRLLAQQYHKVEYDATHGYFPLWEPTLRSDGTPILNAAGLIIRINPVEVTARMVAAWTWYLPENPADRNKLPVLRPRL